MGQTQISITVNYRKKFDNPLTIKTKKIVLCTISPSYVIYLCVHAPLSTLFMQQGLCFVAPGADTAAEECRRGGGATGGRNGFELYHCELIPLFTEE